MKQDRRINYSCSVDHVAVLGSTFTIDGWAVSHGAGNLCGVVANICGQTCKALDQVLDIPSPSIHLALPQLDGSEKCRFRLRFSFPEGIQSDLSNLPLALEPSFAHGIGKIHWHLVASSFPNPPQNLIEAAGGGFQQVAMQFLGHFIDAGLKPTDDVLDAGCGFGRMTYGLVNYLESTARYEGFDIVPGITTWAQKEVSTRYSNFQFRQVPIYNSAYNPRGNLKPTEFMFPYRDKSFDFVFLVSVFTHMPGDAVRHYMDEIRRVLRPGGHCLTTWFLLNGESVSLTMNGKSTIDISHPEGDRKVASVTDPDYATGFEEGLIKDWLEDRGLNVVNTLYGGWCGRNNFTSYQDILITQG